MFKLQLNLVKISITTFVVLFAIGIETQASTIRVPADYPKIQLAINAAQNGDTVLVAPGTYLENLTIMNKSIILRSDAGYTTTVIDGMGIASLPVVEFFNLIPFNETLAPSTLLGFTIRNGGIGVATYNASAKIEDNLIISNLRLGVSIEVDSMVQVLHNIIEKNGDFSSGSGGIDLFAAGHPVIRNNIIRNNSGYPGGAISMSNLSDALIVQNLIVGNTGFQAGGIYWLVGNGTRGPVVVNNTIVNNSSPNGSGVMADGYDKNTVFTNNIVVAKQGQTAFFCGDFNDLNLPIIKYNNIYSSQGLAYGGICPDQTSLNGNISTDPLFENSVMGDYHLKLNSPSIDTGDNYASDLPAKDFDGNPRILDSDRNGSAIIDMGIYEFASPGFDLCLQDDSSNNVLRINSTTGAYQLTRCRDGFTAGGTGMLTKRGCIITLQDFRTDRRITASVDTCVNRATASIQIFSQGTTFTLMDRNITNNTCSCPNSN